MRIVFIRHGQDERDYRGGWSQRGLIPEGHRQAQALAQALHLRWQPFSYLLSSDLPRAAQTAAYIAHALHLPVVYDPVWRETNNGDLAGMHNDLARQRYPGLYFSSLAMDEPYPNGESPQQHLTRITSAFVSLCNQVLHGRLPSDSIIVTHGGVINIIYYLIAHQSWTNKSPSYPVAHTSIHVLQYDDGAWQMVIKNDTSHLDALAGEPT